MNSSIGSVVSAEANEILNQAGVVTTQIGNTGKYVVQSAVNLTEAYSELYTKLYNSGEATLQELNSIVA
mgnify:CR=1 FL=1